MYIYSDKINSTLHVHVLMLHRNFELIPIKIGFFYEFLKLLKNQAKVPYSTWSLAKFHEN